MPQQDLTNPAVTATDTVTIAREAHSVSVTYQLERIKRGFDSLTLERLPGGLNITKRVSTRGAVRTVTMLIPNELIAIFLEEFAGLVEDDDTAVGAPVTAISHVRLEGIAAMPVAVDEASEPEAVSVCPCGYVSELYPGASDEARREYEEAWTSHAETCDFDEEL